MQKIYRRFILFLSIAVVVCTTLFPAVPTSALTFKAIQDSKNYKPWYDKNDTTAACAISSTGTALVGAKDVDKVFNYLSAPGRLQPFQAAGVMGNMMAESGIQPQRLQGTASGVITPAEKVSGNTGWGLVQWTPASKFISTNNPISKANDLAVQLDFIWAQLEGKGPLSEKQAGDDVKAAPNIDEAVKAFQGTLKIGGKYVGFERPADEAATLPDRIAAAKVILRDQGGGSGAGGGGGSACGGGVQATGVIADAIKFAMDYAWPVYHPAPYTAMKPSYEAAVNAAKAKGEYIGGIAHPGIDCGGFITRVMRNSGADPTYNAQNGPTTAQQAYLESSPKYQKLGTQTSTAKLLPGDIAINDSHTYMYVGKQPGFNGNSASASLDERAPMASNAYFDIGGTPFKWYRLIK